MNKLILMVMASAVVASMGLNCPCKGLGDAILASRERAAYAASYNPLMTQAARDAAWKQGEYVRAVLVHELFGCHKHGHRRGV